MELNSGPKLLQEIIASLMGGLSSYMEYILNLTLFW